MSEMTAFFRSLGKTLSTSPEGPGRKFEVIFFDSAGQSSLKRKPKNRTKPMTTATVLALSERI